MRGKGHRIIEALYSRWLADYKGNGKAFRHPVLRFLAEDCGLACAFRRAEALNRPCTAGSMCDAFGVLLGESTVSYPLHR